MALDTPAREFARFDSEAAILELIARWRSRALPRAEWTHQAHLAVGLWHVLTVGEAAALPLLRWGITDYNSSVDVPNNDARGYHESITRFYVWSAGRWLERAPRRAAFVDLVNGYVESREGSKAWPLEFWSREALFSVAARRRWVEPDLRPLA
jgi:hypothetical protein